MDEECSSPLVVPGVNPSSTESGKGSNEPLVSPRKRRSLAEHGYIFMTVTQVVGLCLLAFVVGACIPIAMKLNRMRTHTTTGSAATSGSTTPSITIQTPTDQLFNNLRQPPSLLKTDKSRIKANTNLKIAWLMSFPNSGASYTLYLVSSVSNTSVATNYGLESPEEFHNGNRSTTKQKNVPVFPIITTTSDVAKTADNRDTMAAGPFWWQPNSLTEQQQSQLLPTKTVLTKTYCGGYCHDCKALASVETPHSFMMHCAMADVDVLKVDDAAGMDEDDGEHPRERYTYEYNTIDRAVHLIRHPLDNMVSRFHSDIARLLAAAGENKTEIEWIQRYTYDSVGFQTYCSDVTDSHDERKDSHIDQQVLRLIEDIPCHMDIFRYVQWHNLAFITTNNNLNVPSHVVHYEDYKSNLEGTLKPLLDFLELPDARMTLNDVDASAPAFTSPSEPSYLDYYTTDQRDRIHTAIMMLASPVTWQYLERYFDQD